MDSEILTWLLIAACAAGFGGGAAWQAMRRRAPAQLVQTVCELCARRLPQNMHIPAGEIQVISPTRKGETGTANLNRALQAALNPPHCR